MFLSQECRASYRDLSFGQVKFESCVFGQVVFYVDGSAQLVQGMRLFPQSSPGKCGKKLFYQHL